MQIKTVYSYDGTTKEYSGETFARESPREPGVFHIPSCATETAPPPTGVNEAAVFDEDTKTWTHKPNYKGCAYYNTKTQEKQVITEIGVEPASDWTDITPTDADAAWNGQGWEVSIEALKSRKKAEIAAVRYASATGTISINGNVYLIDKDSQTSFLGTLAALQSGAMGSTIWKTADGRFVMLDAAEFMQVVTIVLAYISACFGAESSMLEQIEAASSADELAAVVWAAPDVSVVLAGLG